MRLGEKATTQTTQIDEIRSQLSAQSDIIKRFSDEIPYQKYLPSLQALLALAQTGNDPISTSTTKEKGSTKRKRDGEDPGIYLTNTLNEKLSDHADEICRSLSEQRVSRILELELSILNHLIEEEKDSDKTMGCLSAELTDAVESLKTGRALQNTKIPALDTDKLKTTLKSKWGEESCCDLSYDQLKLFLKAIKTIELCNKKYLDNPRFIKARIEATLTQVLIEAIEDRAQQAKQSTGHYRETTTGQYNPGLYKNAKHAPAAQATSTLRKSPSCVSFHA